MNKIKNLIIDKDDNDVITVSVTSVSADAIEQNTSMEVATLVANDAGSQLQPNAWQDVHQHFDMFLETSTQSNSLLFKEKNVPEGPSGKGCALSTIPATFLRLGLISEEEYYAFNQAIVEHPVCQKRLDHIVQQNAKSQQKIMAIFDKKFEDIKKSHRK